MRLFDFAQPALFALPPENAHAASIKALKMGLIPSPSRRPDERLRITLGGLDFPNPVGLAAGYDKNAEVPDAVLRLGFGFTEVGTITPRPQTGNPKPRVFRLVTDKALINRLGFNNQGHQAALKRLNTRAQNNGIVGVNIGANKDSENFFADYELGISAFYEVASYFTANISSPNTPGLRSLQAGDALKILLDRIFEQIEKGLDKYGHSVPVFLKIAPDLNQDEISEIAEVAASSKLSALIVSNTTLDRSDLTYKRYAKEAGGLSGKPLFEKSTRVLAQMHKLVGKKLPIIGVGGISSADQAIKKIEAGASLVQLYTGMVYAGPGLPGDIVHGLSNYLDREGVSSIQDRVGFANGNWI